MTDTTTRYATAWAAGIDLDHLRTATDDHLREVLEQAVLDGATYSPATAKAMPHFAPEGVLRNGYRLVRWACFNGSSYALLAVSNPDPDWAGREFATWDANADGDCYWGHYFCCEDGGNVRAADRAFADFQHRARRLADGMRQAIVNAEGFLLDP